MNDVYETYAALIERFLTRELAAGDFQRAYLQQFKSETSPLDDALFALLDELFGDVDSYTTDHALLAEAPRFYLDEAGLRLKAGDILRRLKLHASDTLLRRPVLK